MHCTVQMMMPADLINYRFIIRVVVLPQCHVNMSSIVVAANESVCFFFFGLFPRANLQFSLASRCVVQLKKKKLPFFFLAGEELKRLGN